MISALAGGSTATKPRIVFFDFVLLPRVDFFVYDPEGPVLVLWLRVELDHSEIPLHRTSDLELDPRLAKLFLGVSRACIVEGPEDFLPSSS